MTVSLAHQLPMHAGYLGPTTLEELMDELEDLPEAPALDEMFGDMDAITASTNLKQDPGPQLPHHLTDPILTFVEYHYQQTFPDLSRPGASPLDEELLNAMTTANDQARKRRWLLAGETVGRAISLVMKELEGTGWPHSCWQEAHGFLRVIAAAHCAVTKRWRRALHHLDLGLIFGLPQDDMSLKIVPGLLAHVEPRARLDLASFVMPIVAPPQPAAREAGDICGLCRALDMTAGPAQGLSALRQANLPVVLTDGAAGWPALQKWRDLGFWDTQHGHRLVPVYFGTISLKGSLTSGPPQDGSEEGLVEKKVTFHKFVEEYLQQSVLQGLWPRYKPGSSGEVAAGERPPVACLANYDLFRQLPQLQRDFEADPLPRDGESSLDPAPSCVTMWFGTGGTVMPLRFEEKDNLMVQIAGLKLVRVYNGTETKHLSEYVEDCTQGPYGTHGPVCLVDVENPDFEKYPSLKEAVFAEHILRPGESLYIPRGAWCYVRALTTSVTVNFSFSPW